MLMDDLPKAGILSYVAVISTTLFGCRVGIVSSEHSTVRDNSPIQTDSTVYTLRPVLGGYAATASVLYVNHSSSPVYYVPCNPGLPHPDVDLHRAGADTMRHYIGISCIRPGGVSTLTLDPGDTLTFTVDLGSLGNIRPGITMAHRSGLFRIALKLCERFTIESDYCVLLPIEQRRSNAFRVAPPD